MTEDMDERMGRASRIRNMREGQREAADADDEDGDESGAGADATQSDAETPAAETVSDDSVDESEPATTAASENSDDAAAETAADRSDQSEPDEAAAAAAQRAAEAAAQVSGGVSGEARTAQATTAEEPAEAGADATADTGQPAAADASEAPMSGPTGVELPDEGSIQATIADEVVESDPEEVAAEPATGRGAAAQEQATAEDTVRVLEFTLGDEDYCLDIAHVEEIVKRNSITRVPNTPAYVEGVVDLRGQITTILDPKLLLDIDQEGSESLLVVFAPDAFEDQGAIGWVVDEVRQVAPIVKSEVSAAPVDADYIEGVIDREDEEDFVIWTNPEMAIRLATGQRESDE